MFWLVFNLFGYVLDTCNAWLCRLGTRDTLYVRMYMAQHKLIQPGVICCHEPSRPHKYRKHVGPCVWLANADNRHDRPSDGILCWVVLAPWTRGSACQAVRLWWLILCHPSCWPDCLRTWHDSPSGASAISVNNNNNNNKQICIAP